MRFALPRNRADANRQWSPLGSTLAWLKYQCLVIEELCNLSSLLWLGAFIYYLKYVLQLEDGPILYAGYGLLLVAILFTIPHLWVAGRCLIGRPHKKVGPLAMLLGGHRRWREQWEQQIRIPNEQLAEQAKQTGKQIQRHQHHAKEQRLRGSELEMATGKQHQVLLDLFEAIPSQWTGGSMFYGRLRDDQTPLFRSDDIERDLKLCLANVVMKTFVDFYHVIAYREGPASLVLLFDRREGRLETKVRLNISLVDHGGSYQWALEFATSYFFMPGFVKDSEGDMIPSEGDLSQVRRDILGSWWSAPFRFGVLAPLNPLNIFRVLNLILQGWGWASEREDLTSSTPYYANNYLGGGDFTDLCLINKMRAKAMHEGDNYQGPPISLTTERIEKGAEQYTLGIQQVVQAALRSALDLTKITTQQLS